ncbi:MAG: hypothetical protein HC865_24580 [Cyanobacteria bacterium RU_5_0]|nr:hypothetical protein [Cyanobacteria bacterium RU_5_0]
MGRSRRQSASTRFSTADPEKSRFIWLQPNTLFGKLPIIQQITQLERQELEPILGTSKIQLFRNFRDIRIIPTGNSFLLQGINPSGGRVRVKPILDVQFSSKAKENSQAYVRLSEAKVYRAIAKLLESKLREQLENEHTDSLFAQFAEQSQPLSFFPIILDSIVNPETFKQLSAFVRVRLEFHPENHTIAIKNSENISLFLLQPKQLAYLILLHVISEYEYYQAFDYPLPEVIQNSLMILSIQGKTSIPSKYLEPRVKDLFPQEFQACEDVIIEFLQADTPDKSLLIFSSSQLNTRLYPRLKLADAVALELLGMLYSFTYPLLKQQGRWERAATLFRFMSLYELFQDEEFKHFRLTRISLKKLLEISFGSVTQTDLVSTAVDEQLEVQFVNANDNLHIDLRLSFTSPEEMQSYHSIVNTVSISHRHPHFYACLELITQLWSSSEERLRFLDANWMNKLVEQLRQAGNYWISYFELQPHLQKLSESPNPEIARLVQKLYVNATQPRPYFRYFLGIQGEDLIISPYPIFLENWSSATINFEITEENSLRLNIFASRSPHFFGFCRKVLALAKIYLI